jgi:hypothetical protein
VKKSCLDWELQPKRGLCLAAVMVALMGQLTGCGVGRAAQGESYQAPMLADSANSQIIIYRPKQTWREEAGSYPEVFLGDQSIGVLRYNGFLVQEVPPGQLQLKVTGLTAPASKWSHRDREIPMITEAGKTYYFRVVVRYDQSSNTLGNPGMDYLLIVNPVSEDDAKYELPGLKASL